MKKHVTAESADSQDGIFCVVTINLQMKPGSELESFEGSLVGDKIQGFLAGFDKIYTYDYHIVVGQEIAIGKKDYSGFESELLFVPDGAEDNN